MSQNPDPAPNPHTEPPSLPAAPIDAVVIGRNEGARLLACLTALQGQLRRIIYVDSGSQDGSVAAAQALGAEVVALDAGLPFTAARARNAGLARLSPAGLQAPQAAGAAEFVLFIDGDCSLQLGFLAQALAAFAKDPAVVVVCGRRAERFPEASVYNRLCDREWDTPVGEALACGGDALMRLAPVLAVGGYRDSLIAGEEPELCQRLRRAGGKILRIDAAMTLHDAAMTRFGQWWRRSRRAGYAFAEGAALHGQGPDRHWRAETRRAVLWGALLPLLVLLAAALLPYAWLLALVYPLQVLRLGRRWRADGRRGWEAAFFTTLAKFPEALGVLSYHRDHLMGRKTQLIEYK